jgi:hypothetical protein
MNGNNAVWMAAAISNLLADTMTTDELNVWGNILVMAGSNLLAVATLRPPEANADAKSQNAPLPS